MICRKKIFINIQNNKRISDKIITMRLTLNGKTADRREITGETDRNILQKYGGSMLWKLVRTGRREKI